MSARVALVTLLLSGCSSAPAPAGNDAGRAITPDGGSSDAAAPGPTPSPPAGHYFPAGSIYETDISALPAVASSAAITAEMQRLFPPNGWGGGGRMRIDFSIIALEAAQDTAKLAHEPVAGY